MDDFKWVDCKWVYVEGLVGGSAYCQLVDRDGDKKVQVIRPEAPDIKYSVELDDRVTPVYDSVLIEQDGYLWNTVGSKVCDADYPPPEDIKVTCLGMVYARDADAKKFHLNDDVLYRVPVGYAKGQVKKILREEEGGEVFVVVSPQGDDSVREAVSSKDVISAEDGLLGYVNFRYKDGGRCLTLGYCDRDLVTLPLNNHRSGRLLSKTIADIMTDDLGVTVHVNKVFASSRQEIRDLFDPEVHDEVAQVLETIQEELLGLEAEVSVAKLGEDADSKRVVVSVAAPMDVGAHELNNVAEILRGQLGCMLHYLSIGPKKNHRDIEYMHMGGVFDPYEMGSEEEDEELEEWDNDMVDHTDGPGVVIDDDDWDPDEEISPFVEGFDDAVSMVKNAMAESSTDYTAGFRKALEILSKENMLLKMSGDTIISIAEDLEGES